MKKSNQGFYTGKELDIEYQYQQYLKRVHITEAQMGTVQRLETRRAFFAGFTSCLVVMQETVSALPDEAAVGALQTLWQQNLDFWEKQTKK